jgi:hypothetical protein
VAFRGVATILLDLFENVSGFLARIAEIICREMEGQGSISFYSCWLPYYQLKRLIKLASRDNFMLEDNRLFDHKQLGVIRLGEQETRSPA